MCTLCCAPEEYKTPQAVSGNELAMDAYIASHQQQADGGAKGLPLTTGMPYISSSTAQHQ